MLNSDFIKFNKDSIETQPNGYLSLLATITRTGVFNYTYINELGESITIRQLRHPEDVFSPEAMASLMGIPVTNNHPHEFVTPENTSNYIVGMASDQPKTIRLDATDEDGGSQEYIQQLVTLFDPDTIEDVLSGHKQELSLGYELDHENEPGVWNGQEYDVRQRNIRYNHLSVVKKARGGSLCRFNIDAEDVNMDGVCYDKVLNFNTIKGEDMIFNRDGKEYEVKDEVHALLTTLEAEKKSAIDSLDAANAKAEALEEKVTALEAAKSEDAVNEFNTAVAARVKLEKEAGSVLGAEVSLDGLTDKEIKVKVIAATSKVNLDDKSDAYIDARYDMSLEAPATAESNVDFTNTTSNDSVEDVVAVAKARAWDKAMNQWKGK